jgi:hypothetical protein
MFEKTGCQECRNSWTHQFKETSLVDLGKTNFQWQCRLFQCNKCGAYWEDQNGGYPSGITPDDVNKYYGNN